MIDNRPLVSIVVPAYNHAPYLAQAVDSILSQDYPHVELIVLDDGSTDDTRNVLSKYDASFFWETQTNIGQAATLNKGWRLSRGALLGYLSADDFLLPRAISASVIALQANPGAVVAYCDFDLVDPRGNVVRRVTADDFSVDAMLARFSCPPGPGAIFRRTAFERTNGWNPNLKRMPDFDFWLRLSREGHFVHIRQSLAAWRAHEASQTFAAVDRERAAEPIAIMQSFFASPDVAPALCRLKVRSLAQAHLVSAQLHARSGRMSDAAREFTIGCKQWPAILLVHSTWRLLFNSLFNRALHRILWVARRPFQR